MISYIRGYYVITVEGIGTERFLNHIIRNKIEVYNVTRISNTKIKLSVDREDMKKFKNLYRSSNFEVKVKQKTGIPFVLKRIYKQKGMWICAVASLSFLMFTTQFVTDIHIQSPEGIDKDALKQELSTVGLRPGVYKKSIERKEIRDYIMGKFEDVAYVSLNVKGTNIYITITKKAESLKVEEESNYCNIIAQKNGIIKKVIAKSGNAKVEQDQPVFKGDTLLLIAETSALPEVWAETNYTIKKSASYIDEEKEKTGKSKKVFTFNFYDHEYILRRNIKYKDYVIENKEYKLTLGDYTFPLSIKVSAFHEAKSIQVKKDKDNVKSELIKLAENEKDYILPASAKIEDKKTKFNVNGNILEYVIEITAYENIAQKHILSKTEAQAILNEENKPKEGENPPIPSKRPLNDIRNGFEENDIEKSEDNDNKGNTKKDN